MIPVRQCGHDGSLEIFENLIHGFAALGRERRQPVHQIARLHGGQHRIVPNVLEIIRHPVHYLVTVASKLVVVHHGRHSRKTAGSQPRNHSANSGSLRSPSALRGVAKAPLLSLRCLRASLAAAGHGNWSDHARNSITRASNRWVRSCSPATMACSNATMSSGSTEATPDTVPCAPARLCWT